MKLVKCIHCGRPFYNDQEKCPFCSRVALSSSNNFVTKAISDPKSHDMMLLRLSGQWPENDTAVEEQETPTADNATIDTTPEPVEQEAMATEQTNEANQEPSEQLATEEAKVEETTNETVENRADAMAAIASQHSQINEEDVEMPEEHQLETNDKPRKKHTWLWIVLIVIVVAIAVFAFLKWDMIAEKIASIKS